MTRKIEAFSRRIIATITFLTLTIPKENAHCRTSRQLSVFNTRKKDKTSTTKHTKRGNLAVCHVIVQTERYQRSLGREYD